MGLKARSAPSDESRSVDRLHGSQVGTRTVSLALHGFGREAIDTLAQRYGIPRSRFVERAVAHHLEEGAVRRPGYALPPFRSEPADDELWLELSLPAGSWDALELECAVEGLSLERLLEHTALALLADLDSGRVAVRIAADLD